MKSNKKPIIAISLDMQDGALAAYSDYPWYALRMDYANAVSANGGVPIMLPFDEDSIDEVLDIADGLIIPGGDVDIDPKFYGEEVTSDTVIINHTRTAYDMRLLEKALAKNMPFLGICYGMQLLNVFLGGSLIQDIQNHKQPKPKNHPWHDINIEPNTKLAQIASHNLVWKVNSTHHQAVDRIGKNLLITAIAYDGVVEAIESTTHEFAIGLEWHPEYQNIELDVAVFREFVKACMNYKELKK